MPRSAGDSDREVGEILDSPHDTLDAAHTLTVYVGSNIDVRVRW